MPIIELADACGPAGRGGVYNAPSMIIPHQRAGQGQQLFMGMGFFQDGG